MGGGGALVVGILLATSSAIGTRDDVDTLSQQVLAACAAGGQAAVELQALGSCPLAADVQADTLQPPLVDTGLSASQTAEVITLVRGELSSNPPRDGRTPDGAAVQAAVRAVAAADPALFRGDRGDRGEPGEPGQAPTDDQVRAIAASVIAADPDAFRGDDGEMGDPGDQGDQGEPGVPGRGIVSSEEDPDDPCVRIVRYDQPPLQERWRTCADPTADPTTPPPTSIPPTTPPTTEPEQPGGGGLLG